MSHGRLKKLLFWALCCDFGFIAKKLIAPGANIITDALHIPGGIATSFSLMFLVLGASILPGRGCGTLMGLVQGAMALALGRLGSMGVLAPIGYVLPGAAIDIGLWFAKKRNLERLDSCVLANTLAGLAACLTANAIVFHLRGWTLILYASLAAFTGALCGVPAGRLADRIAKALQV